MYVGFFLTTVITGLILLYVWYTEPRRLALGAAFLIFMLSLAFTTIYLLMMSEDMMILMVFLILILIVILLSPLLLIGNFLYSGIMLIKREGLKFHNLLSLMLGIGLILYLTVWPIVADLTQHTVYNSIYAYITLLLFYFMLVINLYTVSMVLNLLHFRRVDVDYLVVLGSGLDGNHVTPLLASRIDKAIELYRQNPQVKLIMTGGKGSDEIVTEASAMARYALEQGLPPEAIILEDKAVNTEKNIMFSRALMDSNTAKFAIVSNNYHVFRALLIAKGAGIPCIGYGARSKWYFSLNAYIREFIGYLYLKRNLHLTIIVSFTLLYLLLYAVLTFILLDAGAMLP